MPRVRWFVLGVFLCGVVPMQTHAADGAVPVITDCLAFPGWWVDASGRRFFEVNDGGYYVSRGRIPGNPLVPSCGDFPIAQHQHFLPSCTVEVDQGCSTRLQIVFVTATFGILTAQRGFQPACTPCMQWSAVLVHPETVPTAAVTWGRMKQLYQ